MVVLIVVLVEAFSLLVLNFVIESCCFEWHRVVQYVATSTRAHTHTQKIKFAPVTRMVVVTRRFVTHMTFGASSSRVRFLDV